ncbi:MAG: flagellar basal body P-ring protein FlgI [Gammaproteobacteria bacterium]|nr:flagellar basal body P-ring protein FlgI [Gammaproteobacteria bacterium]MCG3144221.1 Flagellar P-ring protein [Gammaproteobacteria bacterium]
MKRVLTGLVAGAMLALGATAVQAERIKDIARIAGVRDNQLVGYGLVVGLDGTGDKTEFTAQTAKNMVKQLGLTLPQKVKPSLKNAAAVIVQATLPPFAKPGQTIDVTVSSLGDAKSLRGGSLVMTPLKGADGGVYAIAQGNVVVGGLGVETTDGSSISINVPSSGRIANGATVEREVMTAFNQGDQLLLTLNFPDFTTATRMAEAINANGGRAQPIDGSSVAVAMPVDPQQRVAFMSQVENLELSPGEAAAKVVVNSRTGTIVIGQHVAVSAAAVTHGSLTVTITNDPIVSQPPPLSRGDTVVVPKQNIDVKEEKNRMFLFNPGVRLDDIVRAVNAVGAAPGDLVAILEALKQAGALKAELVVI